MVSSGVLGPVLFLIFISDVDSALVSMILKFADDTKVLGKGNSDKDGEIIQQDLHRVLNWSYMWQMPFNTIKCGHAPRCQECSAHLCHGESGTCGCDRGEGPGCDCL